MTRRGLRQRGSHFGWILVPWWYANYDFFIAEINFEKRLYWHESQCVVWWFVDIFSLRTRLIHYILVWNEANTWNITGAVRLAILEPNQKNPHVRAVRLDATHSYARVWRAETWHRKYNELWTHSQSEVWTNITIDSVMYNILLIRRIVFSSPGTSYPSPA